MLSDTIFEQKSMLPSRMLDSIQDGTLPLIAVVGPTASGKTRMAVVLAKAFNV